MTLDNLSGILLRTAVAIFLIAAAIHICTPCCAPTIGDSSIEYQTSGIHVGIIHIQRVP